MIDKVIDVLKDCIRRGEKLDEVADSIANTGRDDTENQECNQKPERPYKLECVQIGHVNTGSYEITEYYEL